MDRKSKVLLIFVVLFLILGLLATLYKTFILGDYEIRADLSE